MNSLINVSKGYSHKYCGCCCCEINARRWLIGKMNCIRVCIEILGSNFVARAMAESEVRLDAQSPPCAFKLLCRFFAFVCLPQNSKLYCLSSRFSFFFFKIVWSTQDRVYPKGPKRYLALIHQPGAHQFIVCSLLMRLRFITKKKGTYQFTATKVEKVGALSRFFDLLLILADSKKKELGTVRRAVKERFYRWDWLFVSLSLLLVDF